MVFDPKVYRDNRSGIGMPDDAIATDTTSPWTAISLLKALVGKLGSLVNPLAIVVTTTLDAVVKIGDAANNAMRVRIVASDVGASGGTAMVDDAEFTPGTTNVTPAGGTYRTVRDDLDDNDVGAIALTLKRAVITTVETPLGDSAMDDVNDAIRVNVVAGTPAGGTSMVDDEAFTPGTTSVTPIAGTYRTVRDNLDDNDGGTIALTQKRAQYTTMETPDGDSAMDDTNNALRVNIVAGASSSGTSMVDDAGFTPGSTAFTPAGGTYRSVRDLVDDTDGGAFAMTQRRALLVSHETPAGDSLVDDTNDLLRVAIVPGQNGITAGAGAVGASTPRVTLASDDPVTASVQIMDDWDESDRAKVNPIAGQAGVAAGAGAVSALTQRVVIATDQTALDTAKYNTTKALTNASISISSSGENAVVAGTGGQTIRVFRLVLVASALVDISFKDAASGTVLTGAMSLSALGSMVLESTNSEPLFVTATAGAFIVNLSSAVAVNGFIQYTKS